MWYLQRRNSRPIGPVPTDEVLDGLRSGEIPHDTMVCAADGKQWIPIGGVPELAASLVAQKVAKEAEPTTLDEGTAPEPAPLPRPRIIRRIEPMPAKGRARAALAVSGAVLALSMLAMLLVFAPTPALAALLDAVHALRSSLVTAGALGAVAWGTAALAAFRMASGKLAARSIARAAGLPLLVSVGALVVGLVAVGRGLAGRADVAQSRTILASLLIASLVAALAWTALVGRALWSGIDGKKELIVAAAVAIVSAIALPGARSLAAVTDVVPIEGPVFDDQATLRKHVEALRAGASGVAALDETLTSAVFVAKGTRVRYLDELVVEAHAGAFVARKVLLLDGPARGRAVFLQR